jgi:hypothetical protein
MKSGMHVHAQGKGEGQLQLKLTYFPFELLYSRPRDASLVRLPPPSCPMLALNIALPLHT